MANGASYTSIASGTTYYTAQTHYDSHTTVSTAFYSVQDPAVVHVNSLSDFQQQFRELDISSSISNVAEQPSGRGASADVRQADLNVPPGVVRVALKIPRVTHADVYVLKRLAREIGLWRTLSHPNVLRIFGLAWDTSDLPAIVSPWYENGNITDYVAAWSFSSEADAVSFKLRLLQGAARGLAHLHNLNVIHGDLKGPNILVSDDGEACIADFGISAVLSEYPPRAETIAGTYRWMAPELLEDDSFLSWDSDMWAFGCVVLEVASGERPFHTLIEEQKVIIALHDGQVPPRPPGVWDPLWNVSTACCALAAASRPRAEAISTRLGVLLEIVLGTASTPGPVKRDPNETHRVTRLTTSLSVLAARLEVTDEAADDPPIVKRILGSAVLIVKYAEKVDKNKVDMHALAKKSATLAQKIPTVVAGRTVDGQLSVDLERVKQIFTLVEEFMANVASGGRVRRAYKHLFIDGKEVGNLSVQLEDAINAFLLTARDTRLVVQKNVQHVGEFHLVRHSDVRKEGDVFHELRSDDNLLSIMFTRVRVSGKLLVLRYFEEASAHRQGTSDEFRWRMLQHGTLLEKLSTGQMSHPNIARLYGFGVGSVETRFTLIKSGCHSVSHHIWSLPGDERTNTSSAIIWKVLDAISHLELNCGVAWQPDCISESIFLDDMGEPTIGLADDLMESSIVESRPWRTQFIALQWQTTTFLSQSWSTPCCLLDEIRGFSNPANEEDGRFLQLWTMLAIMPISAELIYTYKYLCKKHADQYRGIAFTDNDRMFVTFLHMVATGNQNEIFDVVYGIADFESQDCITCHRLMNSGDTVLFRPYRFEVPKNLRLEARSILGLFPPLAGDQRVFCGEFPPSPVARSCTQSSPSPRPSV